MSASRREGTIWHVLVFVVAWIALGWLVFGDTEASDVPHGSDMPWMMLGP